MAFLRRSTRLPSHVRSVRNIARKWIDGEGRKRRHEAPLFDLQLRGPLKQEKGKTKIYPPVEDVLQEGLQREAAVKLKFEIPEETICLKDLQPDFKSSAMGKLLMEMGIEGKEFERLTERNPRAFHQTSQEAKQWRRSFCRTLGVSNAELGEMIKKFPKLMTKDVQRLERVQELLRQRLQMEDEDVKQTAVRNPFVFDQPFESRFDRAMVVLYERFKITAFDVKELARRYPEFLTSVDEGRLVRLATLFERVVGLGPNQVGKLIKDCPQLISHTIFGLHERLIFLLHYKLAESQVRGMLMECPSLLNTRFTAELRHVVNYLEAALHADKAVVSKIVVRAPSVLKMDTERDIAPNLAALNNLGFSRHEVALMIVRCPTILTLSLYDTQIEQKVEFLTQKLDKDITSLVTYPNYLTFSIQDHILPRVNFLRSLGRTDYKAWPLMKLFGDSDEEFCIRHVKTVPEKFLAFKQQQTEPSQL